MGEKGDSKKQNVVVETGDLRREKVNLEALLYDANC